MSLALSVKEREEIIADYFSQASRFSKIYLANHSLGRPLDQMVENISEYCSLWFSDMDEAWTPWMAAMKDYRVQIAKLLNNVPEGYIIPKTSAGQGLRAVLNSFDRSQPINIVTTSLEFDSIDTILRIYMGRKLAHVTFVEPSQIVNGVAHFSGQEIIQSITSETDLVIFSAVNFTTGQIMPMQSEIVEYAHKNGAYVLADTYHSFGVLPEPCHPMVDFAIGGSYKYVHGGAGSCWLYVCPEIADDPAISTLDIGWFAKVSTFGYQRNDVPKLAQGGRGWWESTPPVITIYQALAGLTFLNEIGIDRLRATSLNDLELLRASLESKGLPVFIPANPSDFGAFALLPCKNSEAVVSHLKDNNITVDARGNSVRICPDLLNTKKDFDTLAEVLSQYRSENSDAFSF